MPAMAKPWRALSGKPPVDGLILWREPTGPVLIHDIHIGIGRNLSGQKCHDVLCAGQAVLIAQLGSFAVCHHYFNIPYRMFTGTALLLTVLSVLLITVAGASGSLLTVWRRRIPASILCLCFGLTAGGS